MNQKMIYVLENYIGLFLCSILSIIAWAQKSFLIPGSAPSSKVEKVLFLKFIEQGALILHQKTFLKAIKEYGIDNVYICTFSSNKELLSLLGFFNPANIIQLNEKSIYGFTVSFINALIYCRQKNITASIDLEFFSRATAIFAFLSGTKYRAGYHNDDNCKAYRGNLLTHKSVYSPSLHVSKTGWELLDSIRYAPDSIQPDLSAYDWSTYKNFRFHPEPPDITATRKALAATGLSYNKIIVLNPNFNDPLPHRQWPPEKYAQLINHFQDIFPDPIFVLTGRSDESAPTDRFILENNLTRAVNYCGKTTLRSLLTLYSISDLLICSDSGPGHFASLTNIRSIVLFGPETPKLYSPLSDQIKVIYKNLPCSPCYNAYNQRTTNCRNNLCMKNIEIADIVREIAVYDTPKSN